MKKSKRVNYLYDFVVLCMLLYIFASLLLILMDSEHVFKNQIFLTAQVALGILLASLPKLIRRFTGYQFPTILVTVYLIFIFMAILLGSGLQFYSIPYWDKIEHVFSAVILGGLGYSVFALLTSEAELKTASPLLMSLFAVAFGTMIGVLWEFYEFLGDGVFNTDMQRYLISSNHMLAGRAALMDTMGDLFADFGGALVIAIWGYFGVKKDRHWLDKLVFKRSKK